MGTWSRPKDLVRHSFFNEDGGSYDKAAAEDSWTRVLKFFGEQIGP